MNKLAAVFGACAGGIIAPMVQIAAGHSATAAFAAAGIGALAGAVSCPLIYRITEGVIDGMKLGSGALALLPVVFAVPAIGGPTVAVTAATWGVRALGLN